MLTPEELEKKQYGIPEQRKFPLDTRAHVISAIKFFNYAEPKYRKALATRLIAKIKEYGIKVTPADDNYFYRYYKPTASFIAHYGVSVQNGAKVGSGRYKLGSGKNPYQRKWKSNADFEYKEPVKRGLFDKDWHDQIKEDKETNPLLSKYRYSDMENDIYLKKGIEYKRLHHQDSPNPTKLQQSRTYASMNPETFINDGHFGANIATLKTKQKTIIAGRKAINRMLSELGEQPMPNAKEYKDKVNSFKGLSEDEKKLTPPDFVMRNHDELAQKFIEKAKSEGYGGMIDLWDAQTGFAPTATIFFDNVMDKVGDESIGDFRKTERKDPKWTNKHEKAGRW